MLISYKIPGMLRYCMWSFSTLLLILLSMLGCRLDLSVASIVVSFDNHILYYSSCCCCIIFVLLVNCKISALVPFYFCHIAGMCCLWSLVCWSLTFFPGLLNYCTLVSLCVLAQPVRAIIVSGMLVYCFAGMRNYCIRYVGFLHLCWSVQRLLCVFCRNINRNSNCVVDETLLHIFLLLPRK